METVKQQAFAGKFYPENKEILQKLIEKLISESPKEYNTTTRALIVPHAAYMYSGKVAANAFQYLDKNVKNIFIFAPAHYSSYEGIALTTYDYFETPFGNIEVNKEIIKEISELENTEFVDAAYEQEHAIEVELPFIKTLTQEAKIIPILYENTSYKNITQIIDQYWDNKDNAFVISTDLSHFYSQKDAEKIDGYTAEMIESANIADFHPLQACGSTGIMGLVQFTKNRDFSMIRVALTTSGEIAGSDASVVGYGAWILSEQSKAKFIKEQFSDLVISVCKESIYTGIHTGNSLDVDERIYPQVFYELGACFVTLAVDSKLRGCMGSIFAHKPLINDLAQNAYKSAFADTRFSALTEEEFQRLKIAISILTQPEQIEFSNEEELIEKIEAYKDGLIIQDGNYSAVYLPSVWVQLPDKKEFLESLKQKAGLPPEHFSKTFKAYRFYTVYIDE